MKTIHYLIYTLNPSISFSSISELRKYAEREGKLRYCNISTKSDMQSLKEGDKIITKKGNEAYVLHTIYSPMGSFNSADSSYFEAAKNMGMKQSNIVEVAQIVKFAQWCSAAVELTEKDYNNNNNNNNNENNMNIGNLMDRITPKSVNEVKMAFDGMLCVHTKEGWIGINDKNEILAYPEEMILDVDFPTFLMPKPTVQLVPGDIIKKNNSYIKVTSVAEGNIKGISYSGENRTIKPIKDILFGLNMVQVVVSLAGQLNGNMNPLMLAFLSNESGSSMKKLLPFMALTQNGNVVSQNNNMLAALALMGEGRSENSMKDLLMLNMIQGNNVFGNFGSGTTQPLFPIFGTQTPVTTAPEGTSEIGSTAAPTVLDVADESAN